MQIDLRFVDIPYEMMLVKEYLKLVENNIDGLKAAELKRIDADHGGGDEEDQAVARHLRAQMEDGITTRFLIAAGIVATWAVFEASVVSICDYLRDQEGLLLSLSDLRGDFLQSSGKFLSGVVGISLVDDPAHMGRLKEIALIRHAYAHGNGRLANVREGQRKQLLTLAERYPGLEVTNGYLIVPHSWVSDAQAFVDEVLESLRGRIEEAYPL